MPSEPETGDGGAKRGWVCCYQREILQGDRCLIRPKDVIDPYRWHVNRDILHREEEIMRHEGEMKRSR
jgi:hypothetical protein